MYCILSSFIQENTQELSVTIYTHLVIGYLVAVIYQVGTEKINGRRNSVNKKIIAWIQEEGYFFKC